VSAEIACIQAQRGRVLGATRLITVNQVDDVRCPDRWAAVKALDEFAAIVAEPVGRFFVFDSFCDRRHAEFMRKVDHGADDRRGSRVDKYSV